MNTEHYLFILNDDTNYESNASVFKDAVIETVSYNGGDDKRLKKCLVGFDDDDFKEIILVANRFMIDPIFKVYRISQKIFDINNVITDLSRPAEECDEEF